MPVCPASTSWVCRRQRSKKARSGSGQRSSTRDSSYLPGASPSTSHPLICRRMAGVSISPSPSASSQPPVRWARAARSSKSSFSANSVSPERCAPFAEHCLPPSRPRRRDTRWFCHGTMLRTCSACPDYPRLPQAVCSRSVRISISAKPCPRSPRSLRRWKHLPIPPRCCSWRMCVVRPRPSSPSRWPRRGAQCAARRTAGLREEHVGRTVAASHATAA